MYFKYLRLHSFIIDKKLMFSELVNSGLTQEQITEKLCNRVNELSELTFDKELSEDEELVEA